jgi:osmoprotectant transport system permease protein
MRAVTQNRQMAASMGIRTARIDALTFGLGSGIAGIAGVDPGVIDAASGMGMTRRQLFWRIELPLALPLLIAGLRIVTVQAIGLAVVAALIGAGGLGSFVFEGLGQYAADLVLLGALPAILLALTADFLLQMLSTRTRRHAT